MKPTRPSEATLIRPRAFEGRFLVGVAGLAGIEVPPARSSICRKRSGGEGWWELHVWGMRPVDGWDDEGRGVRSTGAAGHDCC